MKALCIYAGPQARQRLSQHGLSAADIGVIPAAAGGPKGLILGPLDRFIFNEWMPTSQQPVDLVGAMWIIEGLGQKMADNWAAQIDQATGGDGSYTRFMRYHGANDDGHMQKLYQLIDRLCQSPQQLSAIVRTARVTARLYCLQLEETDNEY